MKVLFDAYWWVDGQPSGRRVVDSFVRTWARCFPDDELTAAVPQAHLARARELAGDLPVALRPLRLSPQGLSAMLELGGVADAVGADVVIGQNYTPLRTRALRATFVHDLMFDEHPEFFSRTERAYFAGMPFSARAADLVLTSTAAEAARIARFRPRLADRVRPVGLSVPESFATRTAADPDLGLTAGRFLLCVGRLNVRKNVTRLVEALLAADLLTPEAPLVVVGEPDGVAIARTDPGDGRVRFVGGVDDSALTWLYENCRLFVFPSLDEGFGLPVVEAALSRAPMVLSDIPAFRELAPAAAFFDPTDPASIAAAVGAELAGPPSPSPQVDVPTWPEVVGRIRAAVADLVPARV
ncbi:glycosyltransferase family 1 protein [Modestobacter sp. NPDC049651]|uniref:glycosyltransferase family 4 protein n=1 Tax=unclassified Modestobacter TaxID=2643866 RepID=UPI0033EC902C